MKRAKKKTVPKLQLRDGIVQGLRRELKLDLLYHIPDKMQAPIRTGEGVPSPVTGWNLLLEVCGTGWLVACVFRFVDWIERR